MKAISIQQPWAAAILRLGKTVENRTWATRHRGPLLIHAGKSRRWYDSLDPAAWLRTFGVPLPGVADLPFGAIVGRVDVIACVRLAPPGSPAADDELARLVAGSRWASGPWCWVLRNPRAAAVPVPYPGTTMLFEVPDASVPPDLR